MVIRQLHALARRIGEEDPQSLLLIRAVEAEVKQTWLDAVNGLRRCCYSDRDIARALGVSRPAVTQRWQRAAKDPPGPGNRVQPRRCLPADGAPDGDRDAGGDGHGDRRFGGGGAR